jgi:class 3 adenylate cyclase
VQLHLANWRLFRYSSRKIGGHFMERRLAAILAADVVGFSRLVQTDEAATLRRLKDIWG